MNNIREFIESGILEMYVIGDVTAEETLEVERMAAAYPEIYDHIREINEALENYALGHAIEPRPAAKPFVMATIDYAERISTGEKPVFPPALTQNSTYAEYAKHIDRKDMQVGPDFTGIEARIIGYTASLTTAIVWIKDIEISEVHQREIEKFLILEGTCTINIEDEVHNLVAGDFIVIPVNKRHSVRITSKIPCKALVQRVAC